MWYKRYCSQIFKEQLNDIFKYVVEDLKSPVAWQMTKRYIWQAVSDEGRLSKYPNNLIKRMTYDKYTVFYQVDYNKKEIYLLYLLYRKK